MWVLHFLWYRLGLWGARGFIRTCLTWLVADVGDKLGAPLGYQMGTSVLPHGGLHMAVGLPHSMATGVSKGRAEEVMPEKVKESAYTGPY